MHASLGDQRKIHKLMLRRAFCQTLQGEEGKDTGELSDVIFWREKLHHISRQLQICNGSAILIV